MRWSLSSALLVLFQCVSYLKIYEKKGFELSGKLCKLLINYFLDPGDKRDFNREFMHFGKRAAAELYDLDGGDVGFMSSLN